MVKYGKICKIWQNILKYRLHLFLYIDFNNVIYQFVIATASLLVALLVTS